jgi:7-cyano-7-deazaguanine synthase
MARQRSIVLLSAGLDSAVNLRIAHDRTEVALALTFDYGQLAAAREIAAARAMCLGLGICHRVVRLPWLERISQAAITGDGESLPQPALADLDTAAARDTARAVWVPNRNGVFVNIAASFAEALDCDLIVAGFNAEEAATFPDNSPEYVRAANRALTLSTLRHPRVVSYTQKLDKAAIVRLGRKIHAPICRVWSCYRGSREQCWRCESCLRLERALRETGNWEWFERGTKRRLPQDIWHQSGRVWTGPATWVIEYGQREARRLGSQTVSTGHLLVGLLRAKGIGAAVLKRLGVTLRGVRDAMRRLGMAPSRAKPLPRATGVKYAREVTRAAKLALEEAHALNPEFRMPLIVDTEHILLALAHDAERNDAGRVLRALKVDVGRIRPEVIKALHSASEGES